MAVQWEQIAFADKTASKTTATWSKSIGSGGDYATWAAMIADMPDLIAHEVTVTIKAGTTLTETCELKNKHGLTNEARIMIQAEKYFPTSGAIPTVDSATATTLRDATLATAALGNDYFNGCWVFIVDGTGTDNGFVPITDYVDATGDVVVASWPGTQPDNTSRYIIVGALVDGQAIRTYCVAISNCTCPIYLYGIGLYNATHFGARIKTVSQTTLSYCGVYQMVYSGIYIESVLFLHIIYGGIVKCNTSNNTAHAGITLFTSLLGDVRYCGISDNNKQGCLAERGSFLYSLANFGDGNGLWGSYALRSSQIRIGGIECSGSSGNHSDPGTAGTANADQASVY